jgi:4-amino-4-deoxy-L-arabinose transferase-like glycosyltransferase
VRAVGEPHVNLGHRHSVGYLIAALAAGLLPWTFLLPSAALTLWGARRTIDRWDPRVFAALWIAAVFAPYAVAASKRGVYLLPLYPAVSLLLGWWVAELVRGGVAVRWLRPALHSAGHWPLGFLRCCSPRRPSAARCFDSVSPFFDRRNRLRHRMAAAVPQRPE